MRVQSDLVSCVNTDLQAYVFETRRSIESELENLVSKTSDIKLHPLLKYALLSKGKRLRPILTLLSSQSVGGDPRNVMQLALSFELLHTATLVHDDIIDQDTLRRETKTLHSKWSIKGAILAGDALIALAVNLAADFGPEITKILSDVGLELSDGEYVDSVLSLDDATEQQYLKKTEQKSASLFRGATYCGALVAKGNPPEAEALRKFGEYFGMAYQLNDDLEDLLAKNQISRDLRNGNVTLPFLYLHKHGDNSARTLLRESFGNRSAAPAVVEQMKDRMEKIGAFTYCRRKVAEYLEKSHSSLTVLRDSTFKNYLTQFSDYVDTFED